MAVPPVSVPWFKLDSYETFEGAKEKRTAQLLEVDEPEEHPMPSSPYIIVIGDKKDKLEVLIYLGNWDGSWETF